MFWKIFAWTNLLISGALSIAAVVFYFSKLGILDIVVFLFNDIPLLLIPLFYAYKKYNLKYLPSTLLLKSSFIFTIIYNGEKIFKALNSYDFTSVQALVADLGLHALVILSIVAFALYIMSKEKITLKQIFVE